MFFDFLIFSMSDSKTKLLAIYLLLLPDSAYYLTNRTIMDVLSNILETIKLKGIVYRKLVLRSPWGVDSPPGPHPHFWRLLKGTSFVSVPGEEPINMQIGDLVLLPGNLPNRIADRKNSPCVTMSDYIASRTSGGTPLFSEGEEETILLGGHFEFENKPIHPLISSLPNLIHISGSNGKEHTWLKHTADLIFDEINSEKQGTRVLVTRLSETLFIHTVRAYLAQNKQAQGFLSALADERVTKALKLIQDFPEKDWTLDTLSKEAGMSRTLFFNKFKETVGETPQAYLTRWRIGKAKELLVTGRGNISEIAFRVGYQSEAAFNRLFKIKVHETPAQYRKSRLP
jgi:AraC-like DNA-binding protein